MFGIIMGAVMWNIFKGMPETPQKRRRYKLVTNFAPRR